MLRTLVNLNPLEEAQRLNEFFERAFGTNQENGNFPAQASFTLPIDVYEREGNLFVKAAVPGVKPEELEITIDNSVLTIRGETKQETESSETKVYRREYRYGTFTRSVRLPQDVDTESVEAEFENGFVTIKIPRVIPQKPEPKRVQVRQANTITAHAESLESQNTKSKAANGRSAEKEAVNN